MAVRGPRTAEMSSADEIAERRPIYDPIPILENGDRLTRAEFERRYEAMPELKKAELIEGVVYMPSPVRHHHHGIPHSHMVIWLGLYKVRTPGLVISDNSTVRLDLDNEPQPDVQLLVDPALGGQTTVSDDDYVEGAPELVVEVASSSASYDLGTKKDAFCRNGVREYVVWRVLDGEIDWFVLREGGSTRPWPGTRRASTGARSSPGFGSTPERCSPAISPPSSTSLSRASRPRSTRPWSSG